MLLACIPVVALLGYHAQSGRVVVLEDARLRVAPTQESPGNASIRAGEMVSVRKIEQAYYLIQSQEGALGWLHQGEVASIWPRGEG